MPDVTGVGTTSQSLIGVNDAVTGSDEVWPAGLQGHAVLDELEGKELAVGGHAVGVKLGEVGVILAVGVDEVPEHLVEDGGPDGADGVDGREAVKVGIDVRVGRQAGRVGVGTDAGGRVTDPGAHGVVGGTGVAGVETDGRGEEVGPALAHTAGLAGGETARVGRSTGETVGQPVDVLVDNDTSLEGAVTTRSRVGPEVHPHAAILTIWGGRKISIICSAAILGVKDDKVVALTTLTVVVGLEVAGRLVEAEGVQQVVQLVGRVEELGDGGVPVRDGVGGGDRVGVLEDERGGAGAVVVEVAGAAGRVDLGNGVVATGGGVVAAAVADPRVLRGRDQPRILLDDTATLSRVIDAPGVNLIGGQVRDVVDHAHDLGRLGRIDVGQQPVVQDVRLDAPHELQLTLAIGEVDETSLGVADSAGGASEGEELLVREAGLGDSVGASLDGEAEGIDGSLEGGHGVGVFALLEGRLLGQASRVEAAAVGEDSAILADLESLSAYPVYFALLL